jgi:hypothetical protein
VNRVPACAASHLCKAPPGAPSDRRGRGVRVAARLAEAADPGLGERRHQPQAAFGSGGPGPKPPPQHRANHRFYVFEVLRSRAERRTERPGDARGRRDRPSPRKGKGSARGATSCGADCALGGRVRSTAIFPCDPRLAPDATSPGRARGGNDTGGERLAVGDRIANGRQGCVDLRRRRGVRSSLVGFVAAAPPRN